MITPPKSLQRFYNEAQAAQRLLSQLVEQHSPLKALDANYFISNSQIGPVIRKEGANNPDDPEIFVGIGAVYTRGSAIRGHVALFRDRSRVSSSVMNQIAAELRERFRRERLQVEAYPDFPHLHARTRRLSGAYFQQAHNPLFAGISVSASSNGSDGSLGFFARRFGSVNTTGQEDLVLVSAGHVLLDAENSGYSTVYHPAHRIAARQDLEGRLIAYRAIGHRVMPGITSPVDAAIAYLTSDVDVVPHDVQDGSIIDWLSDNIDVSEEVLSTNNVFKVGAGTGYRQGIFNGIALNWFFKLTSDNGSPIGIGALNDVLFIDSYRPGERFSGEGDSGSPVLVELDRGKYILCGIVIGGLTRRRTTAPARSYVCPIWTIKEQLKIERIISVSTQEAAED